MIKRTILVLLVVLAGSITWGCASSDLDAVGTAAGGLVRDLPTIMTYARF